MERKHYKLYLKEDYDNIPRSTKYKKNQYDENSSFSSQTISSDEDELTSNIDSSNYSITSTCDSNIDRIQENLHSHNESTSSIRTSSTVHQNMERTVPPTPPMFSIIEDVPSISSNHDAERAEVQVLNDSLFYSNYESSIYTSSDDDDADNIGADDDDDDDNIEAGDDSPRPNNRGPFASLNNLIDNEEANEIITASFIVNKIELLFSILKYSWYHSLNSSQTADLCKMFNSALDTEILPESRYLIDKLFYPGEGIEYHAVCPQCKMYIGKFQRKKRTIKCAVCDHMVLLKDPCYRDYFVTFDISDEIQYYLEHNADYYNKITRRREENCNNFTDIYDGLMYKRFVASLPNEDRYSYMTFNFNSDGSPLFKSSKFSIWPVQISLNELPIDTRNTRPITYALWFGHDKPNMSIFLDPFVKTMNIFSENGIACEINGEKKNIKLHGLCCCVDSVARAPMQGIKQFNGYYGCSWCLHPGELVPHDRGNAVKYTLLDEVPEKRTAFNVVIHAQEALNLNNPVFGVKKATSLLILNNFDIVQGFVPDSMHCIALGVVKQFTNYWLSSVNKPYSLSNQEITRIDNYLRMFKVPNQLARSSRSIKDRKFWKAREWENWLLYFSLPVLAEIPRLDKYVAHWSLLVQSFYIMMKTLITVEELEKADTLLKKFVALTQYYYGKDAMSYNVHQLLHVAQSVADWGPLWAHSGYTFESGNGKIVKAVHAGKGVISQICSNINMRKSLMILEKYLLNKEYSPAIDFAIYLETRNTKRSRTLGNIRYFGKDITPNIRLIEELALSREKTRAYKKISKDRCIFTSPSKKNARTDNSYAVTVDKKYIQIVHFMIDDVNFKEYTVCKEIGIESDFSRECTCIKRVASINNNLIAVETDHIKNSCIFMTSNNRNYISTVPNMYSYS